MSPLPSRDRLGEYAHKGIALGLRQFAQAPEQRAARRLAAQAAARPSTDGPALRVVVLTPRDWAAHVHWEATIAQALRLRGADVRFITCGGDLPVCDRVNTWEGPPLPCRSCRRYVHDSLDAHAFPWTPLRESWEAEEPDWPELDELSDAQLHDVEDGGVPLGKLVDIPAKWFLMGSAVEDDPLWTLTLRRFLRSGRRIARSLSDTLDHLSPDVVLLLNGLFLFEAIAWDLCRRRGIDVVTYERGFIKETLLFRRGAPACLGDVSDLWQRWGPVPLTADEDAVLDTYLEDRRHGRRTIDRYWKDPRFEAPARRAGGRLAVLFTNLTWDSAVIGQGLAYGTLQAWLVAVVEEFGRRPQHELVVRIHPAEVKLLGKQTREPLAPFLAERFPLLPANVRVVAAEDPTSSYALMDAADLGLVFTSTTGLEMALRGKPVIVAGRTHYRSKGFTHDVSSPAQLAAALDEQLKSPAVPDVDLARRYAYLFFFRAPVRFDPVEEHVPGLVRITVDDVAALAPGADPAVDRICDGILLGGDFSDDG